MSSKSLNERFTDLADTISEGMGRWWVSVVAALLIVIWTLYCLLTQGSGWWYGQFYNFPLNLVTTVAELFIGFLIAAAANRVERRHDVLLETIQQQAEASVKVTQRDVAVSHKNEQDLNEIKESLSRLELRDNPIPEKGQEEHLRRIAALLQYEEEVIRVCAVYPHKVQVKAMKQALKALGYPPHSVYMALAEGETLPDLDAFLLGPDLEKSDQYDE